jgi:hypothetical protein
MLEALGKQLGGRVIRPWQILLDGVIVQVDGFWQDENETIIAECWAHIGRAKVAQKHKVAADVLKLSYIADLLRATTPNRLVSCYMVFADAEAAQVLSGQSWLAAAGRYRSVKPITVSVPENIVNEIRKAQKAQDLRFHASAE